MPGKKRRVTARRIAHSRRASRTHGLRAIERRGAEALPPDAPEVRALVTLGDVAAEVGGLRDSALWIAQQLGEQWPGERSALALSEAGRLIGLYADIAGRGEAASIEIWAGAVKAMPGELLPADHAEAVRRSGEIATLLLQLVGVGRTWLSGRGVYEPEPPGKPRPLLRYFGEYLERARRQAMRHAALLAMGEGDDEDLSVSLARAAREGGGNGQA